MTTDDRIRHVLHDLTPSVDEQAGWERIQARLAPARRRRRLAATAAVAAVGVLFVGFAIGARVWRPDTSDAAGITGSTVTSTMPATVECPGPGVDAQNLAYLEAWTSLTGSLRTGQCVLAGVHGPEPEMIPGGLGDEMPLYPFEITDDTVLPYGVLAPVADDYPIIHLGRVADTDVHGFLYWVRDPAAVGPTPDIGGALFGPGETMASHPGVWVMGVEGQTITIYTVVPDNAAIAAIGIDGKAQAWQRPVAKASVFVLDEAMMESVEPVITVTVFDRTGTVIAQYEERYPVGPDP
jgi:hypothetical protein